MKKVYILGSINTDFAVSTDVFPKSGDTFCGALACFLSQGKPLEEACVSAGEIASLACTKKGAQSSIPYAVGRERLS